MFEWHDAVRVLVCCLNVYVLYLLIKKYNHEWNEKTKDLWYALVMWTITGGVFSVQGIVLDRPFTVGFVFLIAATMVGGKGIHAKGTWGNPTS